MSTKNIVPRTTGEGSIGRTDKRWGAGYINNLTSTKVTATNVQTTGTATFGGNTTVQGTLNTTGGITSQSTVSGTSGSFTGSVSGGSGNFSGNLTVGGTLNLQGAQQFFFLALSRLKAYNVGDIAFCASAPSWVRLECVQAGTTSVTEPGDYATIESAGGIITDGTVKFIVDDMRDMSSVGDIVFRPFTKTGYLACNGQTVNRADYPRLVAFVTSNSLWTSDQTNEPWKFGQGDGSSTMVLPNYQNRVVQGGASPAKLEAGLPNVEASLSSLYNYYSSGDSKTTAWTKFNNSATERMFVNYTHPQVSETQTDAGFFNTAMRIRLSTGNPIYGSSDTVQPPAIQLIPQIKY